MKSERVETLRYVLKKHGLITLTSQESESFVNVLMNPPLPNLALQKAAERHRKFFAQAGNLMVNRRG